MNRTAVVSELGGRAFGWPWGVRACVMVKGVCSLHEEPDFPRTDRLLCESSGSVAPGMSLAGTLTENMVGRMP